MLKAEIRNIMKMKRSSLSKEDRTKQSREIHQKLMTLELYRVCKGLFSYLSFGTEVDTWELLKDFLLEDQGRRKLYLPRVEEHGLGFYEMKELTSLKRSNFGVPEPDGSHQEPWISPQSKTEVNLMLMPGLAFDSSGNRIGYGAGYYDRYLRDHGETNFIKVALAYDFQVIENIEADPYDVPIDYIITPKQLISCQSI